MATPGAKPKKPELRVVGSTGGRRAPSNPPKAKGQPKPPKKLTAAQRKLWDQYITSAHWLGAADGFQAYMWVVLAERFADKPADMNSAMINQLRQLASELGLDPTSRLRFSNGENDKEDPAESYFD